MEDVSDFIGHLQQSPPSIERELFLFYWKHKNTPAIGLFSTAHGGDCSGNFLLALEGKLEWPETTILQGKKITLEYEQNFNTFVRTIQTTLKHAEKPN